MSPRPDEWGVTAHAAPHGEVNVADTDVFDSWLTVLGPTSTLLWHHLASLLRQGTFRMDVDELSNWAGTAPHQTWKAIDRLVQFGRVLWLDPFTMSVEVLAPLPTRRGVPRSQPRGGRAAVA